MRASQMLSLGMASLLDASPGLLMRGTVRTHVRSEAEAKQKVRKSIPAAVTPR
jgi:hypothetical protein